jgi:hypothetical protein
MHEKVLESERYPQIELLPEALHVSAHAGSVWDVELSGTMRIHGSSRPLTIHVEMDREGDRARVHGQFSIPHVVWGMRDMSNLVLDVEKQVHIEFDAIGRLLPDPVEHAFPAGEQSTPGNRSG